MKSLITKTVLVALSCATVSVFAANHETAAAMQNDTTTLPNAKAGECYAKVIEPATFRTEEQEVVVKEASEKIDIVPAKYQTVTEKVLVQEAAKKIVPVPAVYGNVEEKIEVSAARTAWTKGSGKSAIEANPSLLDAATKGGVNITTAKAGQCYTEYFKAAKFETKQEKVLTQEASSKIEVTPAKYQFVEEKVLVKEASKKVIEVPAVYEKVTEKVLVEAAKTVWKKGRGLAERIDNTTGEIMCLVEVPAVYKTVERNVIKTPATTKVVEIPAEYKVEKVQKLLNPAAEKKVEIPAEYTNVTKSVKVSDAQYVWSDVAVKEASKTGNSICLRQIPAEFKTVKKRVVKTPATTKVVEIPAKYKTVQVNKLVAASKENRIVIPAVTQKVSKKIKVGDEKMNWKRVLCETNMSKDVITDLQRSLSKAGFNPGPIDGSIGAGTLNAVEAYQQKNNLARGGITYATLDALGVRKP